MMYASLAEVRSISAKDVYEGDHDFLLFCLEVVEQTAHFKLEARAGGG